MCACRSRISQMLLCNLYSSETTFWLLLLRIADRTVNLGVYLVTDGNLFPLSVPPLFLSLLLLHTFGYRHVFEKVNWRGALVRNAVTQKKKNFHLLEELLQLQSFSYSNGPSSGCHLQVHLITTMETRPQKVTDTLLWVIVRALLVSKYVSVPSFNVSLFDYLICFIIWQAKIVRL